MHPYAPTHFRNVCDKEVSGASLFRISSLFLPAPPVILFEHIPTFYSRSPHSCDSSTGFSVVGVISGPTAHLSWLSSHPNPSLLDSLFSCVHRWQRSSHKELRAPQIRATHPRRCSITSLISSSLSSSPVSQPLLSCLDSGHGGYKSKHSRSLTT